MNRIRPWFPLLLLLLLSACRSAANSASELTSVTVQLGSTHQALYAGLYAAQQNGDYAQEGLAVNLVEGGSTSDQLAPLLDGTAQFGIIGASALITARAEGHPFVGLATILRRDPVAFFSLADSGIVRLEDFVGKRVQVSSRLRPRLRAMLGHAGLDPDSVIEVPDVTTSDLYSGKVDIASGLVTGTVLAARQAGQHLNLIYPDDYGVHFYSITVFTTEDLIATDPELVTGFLRATLNGWTWAVENPQDVGELIAIYNPDADPAFESASMIASLPYINTGEDYIGWMKPEVWEGMVKTMRDQGELALPVDIETVYTLQFLQQIYAE